MKLSTKFFLIAYIIVLLSFGIGGSILLKNIKSTLYTEQIEKVNTAMDYSIVSFNSLVDISYGEISETQKRD